MMNDEFMQGIMQNVVGMLHMIETDDMDAYLKRVSHNNSLYDTMGPITDPTEWRLSSHNGKRESARIQLQIAQKLLEIRKLTDDLEAIHG